ncbi:MAG: heme exporter protein CcmB [Flavobacteriales bacterium]
MKEISALLQREWLMEIRSRSSVAGLLLYAVAAVYVVFLAAGKISSAEWWVAALWSNGLFVAINTTLRAFQTETAGVQLYLYTLVSPRSLILSKTLYYTLLVSLLNILSLLFFLLFFGGDLPQGASHPAMFLTVLIGSAAMGSVLTFVSGLAYRASQGMSLLAVLGFPVLMPVLLSVVKMTKATMASESIMSDPYAFMITITLGVLSWVLSLVMFPYLWRD